ncbi:MULTISPECIES: hypothetical protein [Streptomyces]|uniref:Uncharacterized protein n=1 Tax=Streptomyces griseus subsp. griseus (strain JCM 4626 / CBS 651.72 / NBRC 13350 / KCC S-0626 / ISP 5235) TaxID=455632 RepID=B1W0D1_STRGG|nr:hypothetical protein [Streptomyces griseus]MBW3704667.1 hypothetical protein [Streptomyces griseus]BAG19020.1 hypothetical protein SGR_2191 [Streptomyces griseus subsp. griseus NBRC 13350]SED33273.1 hypothetical protein SAMN04490359_0058 [Streptomyces griseus]SQA24170.1 Uncharacterised protein [Streptomyces griseus]
MSLTMPDAYRPLVPVRLDVDRWATRRTRRKILAVVHTVTAGQRLLEAVRLLEGDARVQVFFTQAPDVFSHGVGPFLERLGGLVLPWHQAVQLPFDLAVAAAHGGLQELHAPVIVLPHGVGHNKLIPAGQRGRPVAGRGIYGLDRQWLIQDGRLVPESIVLAHHEDLTRLGRACPEALPAAEVVGDPCSDRITASLPQRALYRDALGVGARQQLVTVCSTWGPGSLLGRQWELLERLVEELPREDFRVALLLHPHVWNAHGEWQIRSWLAGLVGSGLLVISQHADWVGALVAADHVVGDHGSVSLYGAMTGVPVLMGDVPDGDLDPASPAAELASLAPQLHADRPLDRQLARAAAAYRAERYAQVTARITSEPGRFAVRMRALIYRKLRLRAPAARPRTDHAPLPVTARHDAGGYAR